MWHVSSRSGVATLRTAVHLLLTYTQSTLDVQQTRACDAAYEQYCSATRQKE